MSTHRRQFIKQASLLGAAAVIAPGAMASMTREMEANRQFRMSINPGAVGVRADQQTLLRMAHQHGFEAIVPMPQQLAAMTPAALEAFMAEMKEKKITWDAAGLPIEFRRSEEKFREDLANLPALADATQRAGAKGMCTWIMPTHPDLTYRENFEQHRSRLKAAANILGHYGLKLGLEYVGPKTLMASDRYAFIRSMRETRELIDAIGEDNVGFQLDSFHWYCAGENVADLLTLDKEDIVTCDLNDAQQGLTADQQIDQERELPMATGIIDLKSFLGALVRLGYDGPIRAEPFNAKLNAKEDEEALKATFGAMNKAFNLV